MTNQQLTIQTLDLIHDVAKDARQPLKELRTGILEYALELAAKGNTPVAIFQILKAQADSFEKCADDLLDVAGHAWINATKVEIANSRIA